MGTLAPLSRIFILIYSLFALSADAHAAVSTPVQTDAVMGSFLLPQKEVAAFLPAGFEVVPVIPQMSDVHPVSFFASNRIVLYYISNVRKLGSEELFSFVPSALINSEIAKKFGAALGPSALETDFLEMTSDHFIARLGSEDLVTIEIKAPSKFDQNAVAANAKFVLGQMRTLVFSGKVSGKFNCVKFAIDSASVQFRPLQLVGSFSHAFPNIIAKDFMTRHLGQTPLGSFGISGNVVLEAPAACL